MPSILTQIALIIIIVRSAYNAFQLLNRNIKPWMDIAYYISIIIVALSFLL
ncbi:hypothetical protein [Ferviditalea candida]|uniref:Uncharacterized protein n=1 Tax=Ferviditalea candida TaxID=3108399 RepID=A0ABU5ZL96_9BACL|nr:hypothetical protein [Paenibacillaceae bacterium T2]